MSENINMGTDTGMGMGVEKISSKKFITILFWGSIWGIVEATIGYLLHMLPFKVPTGTFLFPIGCYFMYRAYEGTEAEQSAFYTAIVAAAIKLVNFLIPGTPMVKVLNPAMSILMEGLTVFVAFKLFEYRGGHISYLKALAMSLAWRVLYIPYLFAFLPEANIAKSAIGSFSNFVEFFFRNGIINSFIIYLYARFSVKWKKERTARVLHPAISVFLFVVAIFMEWVM